MFFRQRKLGSSLLSLNYAFIVLTIKKDLQKQLLSLIVGKDLSCRIGRNGKIRGTHYFDARKHARILSSWLKSLR